MSGVHGWCDMANNLGWWAISGDQLLAMLLRVAAGEDPDMVYAEEYANCQVETSQGGGDDGG
jgi:hypothetical protein